MSNPKPSFNNIEEVATLFDALANDQINFLRHQTTRADKAECRTKAATWKDAASILRNSTIGREETTP
jgi:hypothetical protein